MLGNHRIMKVRFSSVPDITMSKAAKVAGLTLWEMEKCMIEQGYKSDYSIEDLEKESSFMNKSKNNKFEWFIYFVQKSYFFV